MTRRWQRPTDPRHPWTLNPETSRRYGYPVRAPSRIEVLEARVAALETVVGLALLDPRIGDDLTLADPGAGS